MLNIKTDTQYKKGLDELIRQEEYINDEKSRFKNLGMSDEAVEQAIQPLLVFKQKLKDDLSYYEKIKRGEFEPVTDLMELGTLLVAFRIYRGMTQSEFAKKMGTTEGQVSRDEKNEYFGANMERIRKAMQILNMKITINVQP